MPIEIKAGDEVLRHNTVRISTKTFSWTLQVDALDARLSLFKKDKGKFAPLSNYQDIKIVESGGFVGANPHTSLQAEHPASGEYVMYWDTTEVTPGTYLWVWEGSVDSKSEFKETAEITISEVE